MIAPSISLLLISLASCATKKYDAFMSVDTIDQEFPSLEVAASSRKKTVSSVKPMAYNPPHAEVEDKMCRSVTVKDTLASNETTDCYIATYQKCDGKWTAHGLWYQKQPTCAYSNEALNKFILFDYMADDMMQYYPSCIGNPLVSMDWNASIELWKHQWKKHGWCLTSFKNSNSYFAKILDLTKKYQAEIQSRFEKLRRKINGEVTLCFNSDLTKLMDCVLY